MTRMITNPSQVFDKRRNAWQSPEGRLVAVSDRASQQRFGDLLGLFNRQLGLGARRPLARQRLTSPLIPGAFPPVSHLARDAETAGDIGGGILFGKQLASLVTALFHRGMISRLRHAETIQGQPRYVTLLCDSQ